MTNILKLNVLNLFNNLQTIRMWFADYYPLSLYQLVWTLRHTKIEKVRISTASDTWLLFSME